MPDIDPDLVIRILQPKGLLFTLPKYSLSLKNFADFLRGTEGIRQKKFIFEWPDHLEKKTFFVAQK